MPSTLNRLVKERSPYLRSASHQPVRWYPWSREAFDEAQRLDRPILLDIGASWCHWCHVIDRESYENEEISKFINEHFVAIKVDRDERPDIDGRYQLAVGALTGQGGWPLTAFLTPKGDVFYGGTYFPPDDQYGQPGFKRILKRIAELYHSRKEDILHDAKKISKIFEKSAPAPTALENLNSQLVENCLYALKHQFDFAHGGFGNAPKFFHPNALELVLNQYFFNQQSWLKAVIEKTLDAMAKGGVYDQLGGGFHRYSVDERWVVPHFEKMSYDNASLLIVYAKAFQLMKKPLYEETASGIIRWAQENLMDHERGGFYASQDADTHLNDDGDYYTWTLREAESVLNKEEIRAVLPYFNIEAQGEMHHDPARNVLFIAKEAEILARDLELKPQEVIQHLESAKRKLWAARKKRKAPFVDKTLYANWNGLWIRAFLIAYRCLGEEVLKDFALKTLNRFIEGGYDPETGVVRFLDQKMKPEGFLEDQVEMLEASLEAFEVTGNPEYIEFSQKIVQILFNRFAAPDGGFFDIADTQEEGHLRFRQRRIQDSPASSPNATAARSLLKLSHLTQDRNYLEKAKVLFQFFHEEAKGFSYYASSFIQAFDFYLKGPVKIAVAGDSEDFLFQNLRRTALSTSRPYSFVVPLTQGWKRFSSDPVLDLLDQEHERTGRALALVCSGKTCQPFTDNPEELERQILEAP